jgi:hypothetical protein
MASVETANVGMFHHLRKGERESVVLTSVSVSRTKCCCATRVKKLKSKDALSFYYGAGPMFRRSVH